MIDSDTVVSVDLLVDGATDSDTPVVGDSVPLDARLPVLVQRFSRSVACIEGSK